MDDVYYTIESNSEGIFKDKGSKFISYAFHVSSENEIKKIIQDIKKKHHSARHHCYAWRLGTEKPSVRVNDDGEPSSTAGKPILGQIKGSNLTNILIIVVRYFGGTLLGTGGLINAYRNAASNAIFNATVVKKKIMVHYQLTFSYQEINQVMSLLKKEKIEKPRTEFMEKCIIDFSVRKTKSKSVEKQFQNMHGVEIKKIHQ